MGVVREEDLPLEALQLDAVSAEGKPEPTANASTGEDGPEGEVEDVPDDVKLTPLPEDEASPESYTPPPKRAGTAASRVGKR
jgi:hypothetical protein